MKKRFEKVVEVIKQGSSRSYIVWFFLAAVFVLVSAISLMFFGRTKLYDITEGATVEAFGMLFDLLILGFLVHHFSEKGERKREIERYLEEIDAFRGWQEPEAMYRNVYNLRKLLKLEARGKDLNLSECYFKGANLSGLDLYQTDFFKTNLYGADLSGANLSWSRPENANLSEANLCRTNLSNANLSLACLKGTNLQGANLENVNLSLAKGLILDQLLEVKTLYGAIGLEPELEAQLKKQKPQLFEKVVELEDLL